MKKPKIFIACDTTSIKKINKIFRETEKTRKNLHENLLNTPLFDTSEFSRNFCNAMEKMFSEKKN